MNNKYIMAAALLGLGLLGAIYNYESNIGKENRYNPNASNEELHVRTGTFGPSKLLENIDITTVSCSSLDNSRAGSPKVFRGSLSDDQDTEYIEIKPMDLTGYENWKPTDDKVEYSINKLNSSIMYKEDILKQITNVRADKIIKNGAGKLNYPESTIVCLSIEFDKEDTKNNVINASGVMIGPDTVLTCAHIFYIDDILKKENNMEYKYTRNGKIKNIKVGGDIEELANGKEVGSAIVANATEVYVDSNYINSIAKLESNVANKVYNIDIKDAEYIRSLFENDLAIVKLDGNLGEEIGWAGILPFEVTGNQKWGTLYGYPEIVPKLPELNVIASYLKKDLTRTKDEGLDETRGLVISLTAAIDATKDDGDTLNKKYYNGLMKKNGFEMYSSYSMLDYGPYYPKLLEYYMSSYSGDSGGPIIQSVYNSSTGEYIPYTSGIHLGYCKENGTMNKYYGDLYMYVEDYTGKMINFKDSYLEDVPERDIWRTRIELYGKNYGRQIDKQLYNYLLANELYQGYGYIPEERIQK